MSTAAASVHIPTNSSLSSTASPASVICRLFNDGRSNQCEGPVCVVVLIHPINILSASHVSGLGQAWARAGETAAPATGACSPGRWGPR